jgi:hypothetical protein
MSELMMYSEVLDPASNTWVCEQQSTFQYLSTDEAIMTPVVDMHINSSWQTARLVDILVTGKVPSAAQPPMGFFVRDFPSNMSSQIRAVNLCQKTDFHGWRTKADFLAKAADLLFYDTPESLKALSEWTAFMAHLPLNAAVDDDHQRFIYWFES